MITPAQYPLLPVVDDIGMVMVNYGGTVFRFAPGHRMRAAPCLVCRQVIGGQPVQAVGAVALTGEACRCGGLESDMFLVHDQHMPMSLEDLQAAIGRGLECPNS